MPCIPPFFPRPSAGACLETLSSGAYLIGSSLSAGWVDSASVAVLGRAGPLGAALAHVWEEHLPVTRLLAFVRD